MRGVRQLDLVDGDDVHGPTTAFQDRALATDTPPPTAVAILWSASPATRVLVLQAIEELARISIASTKLLDVDESFKLNLN